MKHSGIELDIVTALARGNIRITVHAAIRMQERSVTEYDLMCVGKSAKRCVYQVTKKTYKVDGFDADGDSLSVICGYDGETVIVTLY